MDNRNRQGLQVLGLALLLGALGDALLRSTLWGLMAAVWVTVLAAATIAVPHPGRAGAISWLLPQSRLQCSLRGAIRHSSSSGTQRLSLPASL
jgi:hypothetical protein